MVHIFKLKVGSFSFVVKCIHFRCRLPKMTAEISTKRKNSVWYTSHNSSGNRHLFTRLHCCWKCILIHECQSNLKLGILDKTGEWADIVYPTIHHQFSDPLLGLTEATVLHHNRGLASGDKSWYKLLLWHTFLVFKPANTVYNSTLYSYFNIYNQD